MMFSKKNNILTEIWANSLDIQEKLRLKAVLIVRKFDNKILTEWEIILGSTNLKFFVKRVTWSRYDNQTIEFLCSKVKFKREIKNKEWVIFIDNLVSFVDINKKNIVFKNEHTPFFDILEGIADFSLSHIRLPEDLFSKEIVSQLKNELISRLSYISQQSLLNEMYMSNKSYREFCEEMLFGNRLLSFFSKYPVLARLIANICLNWIININEVFARFELDKEDIYTTFDIRTNAEIQIIKVGLSDYHNNNKTVCEIDFSDGKKVIYKPRNIDIEYKYFEVLTKWFNKTSGLKDQKVLKVLPRKNFGWVEYVEQKPCKSTTEIESYYYRFGSLLALLHILSGTDCHNENLIASGNYPIIVDCETLFSPQIKTSTEPLNKLTPLIDERFGNSVSGIGILPQWLSGPNGEIYDNSAFGSGADHNLPYQTRKWININKDDMSFKYITKKSEVTKNVIYLNKKRINPLDYSSHFEIGFSETYNFLMKNKDELSNLLFKEFSNLKLRFVFRPTKIYSLILDSLLHPDYMVSGIKRSINMDYISLGLTGNLNRRFKYWNILNCEHKQLENLDIPYFDIKSNSKDIRYDGRILFKNSFQECPLNQALDKIRLLSKEDLDWQLNIIKNSINTERIKKESIDANCLFDLENKSIPTKKFLLNKAKEIGNLLVYSAIVSNDGRCTWVSYVSNIMSHTDSYKPVGHDLANGNMGVSLFLLSLFILTKNQKYKEYGYASLNPIIDILNTDWSKREFADQFGIGGTTGLGSLIYGFATLYEITKDIRLLGYAEDCRDIVTNGRIKDSIRQDFVSGTSGCLAALIKLDSIKSDRKNKLLIKVCVEDILNKRRKNKDGTCAWEYQTSKCLIGFSHGSSGIISCLSKAIDSLQKNRLEKIINKTLCFEASNYSKRFNNWADHRFDKVLWDSVSWCHGAAGVGFSRLVLLRFLKNKRLKTELENAVRKTREVGIGYIDTVCCGNFGRIDFLLTLGLESGCSVLIDEAYKLAKSVIEKREKDGFNFFTNFKTADINVGFYQGISGIGYELLRLVDPISFKSVLIFD